MQKHSCINDSNPLIYNYRPTSKNTYSYTLIKLLLVVDCVCLYVTALKVSPLNLMARTTIGTHIMHVEDDGLTLSISTFVDAVIRIRSSWVNHLSVEQFAM